MAGSSSAAAAAAASATTTHCNDDTSLAAPAGAGGGLTSVARVRHLVVDSGAIIKEVPLHELADNLWTVPDVLTEIKDRRARHVLESLPKRLQVREPTAEAIRFIVDFSRRTGDFRSISDADIRVLALCYDLEKDMNGTAHLQRLPYHELHTDDATGKPLFVCKRAHRAAPPPRATLQSTMDAIRDLLMAQYGIKDSTTVGMGNKFHRSAALALAKRYTEAEAVGILEQYRREAAAQGREKGVHSVRIGQWFSGQLKKLDTQLKAELAAREAARKAREAAAPGTGTAGKEAAPLTGAAAMRALARERRAKTGNAWGMPASPADGDSGGGADAPAVDSADFPKLVVTRDTPAQVRVGSHVDVLPLHAATNDGGDAAAAADAVPPFARGVVAAIADSAGVGLPAMAHVLLQWNLADGSPASLYTPVTTLAVTRGPDSDDGALDGDAGGERAEFAVPALPALPERTAHFMQKKPRVAPAVRQQEQARQQQQATVDAPKSRILPSAAGGGLSSTSFVEEVVDGDGGDGGDWVTPENLGSHLGHDGFTKAFQTATTVPAVGCITTDFAMQNVMLQVGLNLVSAGGKQIQRVRQWVLYCDACFHEMREMERLFCARCGSAGVSKLAVSLTRQGKLQRHFSSNRKVKLLGERYSLPKPKGGRHLDLLLREDQLLQGGWKQAAGRKGLSHSFMGEHVLGSLGMRVGAGSNVVVGMGRTNPNAQRGRERRGKKAKSTHGGKGPSGRRR